MRVKIALPYNRRCIFCKGSYNSKHMINFATRPLRSDSKKLWIPSHQRFSPASVSPGGIQMCSDLRWCKKNMECTHLEVELLELALRVDIHVPRHDNGAGVEGDLRIRWLNVIRCDWGWSAIVSHLLVQDRRRRPRAGCLCLADVVEAQEERQKDDAGDEHAAGAASKDLVHDPRAKFDPSRAFSDGYSPGAPTNVATTESRVDYHCRWPLPDSAHAVCGLHGTRRRSHDL